MADVKEIPGIQIGHVEDLEAATGCTVILTGDGAVCGVDQRGGAPSTRETDLMRPMHTVEQVHAVMLTGGSSFGLAAADGVMSWLEERRIGFDVVVTHVPIVPAAALFDLMLGKAYVRPDSQMGYSACDAATTDFMSRAGNVGAGAGAAVGAIFGPDCRMKGGLGTSIIEVAPGLLVGAAFAVNCFGDVVDPQSGKILAGARNTSEGGFVDSMQALSSAPSSFADAVQNTVIGVVATNATLSKEHANKVAQMAHNGLARTIRPAHTMFDGDTVFALATGKAAGADVNLIGSYAAEATARAIVNAIEKAETLHNIPAMRDL